MSIKHEKWKKHLALECVVRCVVRRSQWVWQFQHQGQRPALFTCRISATAIVLTWMFLHCATWFMFHSTFCYHQWLVFLCFNLPNFYTFHFILKEMNRSAVILIAQFEFLQVIFTLSTSTDGICWLSVRVSIQLRTCLCIKVNRTSILSLTWTHVMNRHKLDEVQQVMPIPCVTATCTISVLFKRQFYATVALDKAEVAAGDTLKNIERLIKAFRLATGGSTTCISFEKGRNQEHR